MPKSVDATGSTPSPWYLDFHLPSGKSDERVHLFFEDKEQSPFKDCGVVKEINKDSSDLDMSPCLGVKVQNGDCYLLEPMAFAWESLKESSDGETMLKAGWIEIKEDTPSENLMDMFIEGFKNVIQYLANLKAQNSKKQKNEGTSQVNQKKALKESEAPSVGNSTGIVEQESFSLVPLDAPHRDEASLIETFLITPSIAIIVDSASLKVLASIVQPEEKDLDKDVKKTNKSGLDKYIGIEHYFKFGVQFTQLINDDQCNLAPDHFKCRPLSGVYVKLLLRQFAKHSRPVSNAADLMPYDPIKKEPLKANEVHADKLATYHYWIISGQHYIIAARAFLHNKSMKYASRREFYKYRTSRIVVDAPKEVAVRISKMENIKTQTTMKTQPYVEVLKHGHGQWLAYSCPKKPKAGVPRGHESRKDWDAFVIVANITFNHSSFANREAHMVMYPEDIYEQWITILENHQASFARGRQPSITTFRCLRGLEDEDVKLSQQELKEKKICLVKQPHQPDMLDLSARATNIKQTKHAIKCICLKEDDKVVDIFSLGYGTKEALLQQQKVISIACTNEQMTELEALCHSTIDEDDELKRWAGLVSTPQNDNGKDSKNEEIDEPLNAEADAILELLQETGQQDIAIEDVSCEVIDTEDVQAIETTEKDPLNFHLNQIVYKYDDKETQASKALQQNFTVNNVTCEVIDTKDAPTVEPIDEESINPHLNQQACKEDDKEIQVFEGQPLQLLETKSSNTMEVDDDASSKTCRRTAKDSTKNILVAHDLSTRVHGDPNLSSNDGPTLTIILSLCGLLLRRCWQKSKKLKSLKFEHEYIVLRPGCTKFLNSFLSISNVGIWSAANDTQVMQIIKILEKEAREQFPFFMIWGQSQCQQCVESRITRPDNPGVEAFFKPLAIASTKFRIDLKRLFLIDDAPLKGCINPALNCIFSPSFNIDEEDNILLGELLPYTKALHHVNDICIITESYLYGQAPIVQGHDLYNHVQKVVIEKEERNLVCLQKIYSTSKLPEAPRVLDDENGASSSTTGMSTRSGDKKRLKKK
ncbi:hypothetical protein L7F22_035684 [Adiantum nelumboides]|nr:hypothetical protein [Adiantum nelumboides]